MKNKLKLNSVFLQEERNSESTAYVVTAVICSLPWGGGDEAVPLRLRNARFPLSEGFCHS